jgi:F0F1-type ATP synthase membrane subunit c/vacuolar-type H+-ATPase subunit K
MTDFENLSKEQIRAALKNNLEFALNFVVDNQPDLIVSELKANGSENVVDSDTAFNNLLFLSQNNPAKLREVLSGIPYDNSATNYTGNLKPNSPVIANEIQTRGDIDWGTILTVVGAALPVVSTLIGSGGGAGGNVNSVQAQEIEAARIKAEQERKSRTNLFIIGGVIAAIVIVILVVKRPNKTK